MKRTRSEGELFKFRLYIAGDGPNSVLATANLTTLCQARVALRFEIEIIDVLREPQRALADGVFMTPLLMRLSPGKIQKVLGSLVNPDVILEAMGLPASAS